MESTLVLEKMETRDGSPIQYSLTAIDQTISINEALGKLVSLTYTGRNFCTLCNRQSSKLFGEGLCYPCFRDAPENAPCILKPELCRAHLGEGRDPAWEEKHHLQPHFVYLAQTSEVKVGVTRSTQIPTRWIDQGAKRTIVLCSVPYRQLAGAIEVFLKAYLTDKTNWSKMLTDQFDPEIDLVGWKLDLLAKLPDELVQYAEPANDVFDFNYPVLKYPTKVASINMEKQPHIAGVLEGIRGQYLIFENGYVFNVRKHSGMEAEIRWL
jgi:hypothetical protein